MARRKGTETRAAILAASLTAFSERGYANTTLEQIGETLGITRPAVLHHFGSKKDLAGALLLPLLDDGEALLNAAEQHAPLLDETSRKNLVRDMVAAFFSHARLLQVITDPSTELPDPVRDRSRGLRERFIALLAGTSSDPETLYRVAVADGALLRSFHTNNLVFAEKLDARTQQDVIFGAVWAALTSTSDGTASDRARNSPGTTGTPANLTDADAALLTVATV